jgi:hypothetical protein
MGKQKKQEEKCKFWPMGFWTGDICVCRSEKFLTGQIVIVVSALVKDVPDGHVPVVPSSEDLSCSRSNIPAEDLCLYGPTIKRYSPSKTGNRCAVWAMGFTVGDLIWVNRKKARITVAFPEEVMLGHVPFWYENEPFSKNRTPHCAPADSIFRR